jgi:hypothetical protein
MISHSCRTIVSSFGGVASKNFLSGVSQGRNLDEVRVCHTHMRTPPKEIPDGTRVVYIFGDPLNAVISFFNRRFYLHSGHGYIAQPTRTSRTDWAYEHCKKIQGDFSRFSSEWDLEDYLSQGEDLFGLEEHFDNWITAQVDYHIMLIRHETLWDHLTEIFDFLNLPHSEIEKFPPCKKRSSNWQDEPKHIQKKLFEVYGKLYNKIIEHPDIKII